MNGRAADSRAPVVPSSAAYVACLAATLLGSACSSRSSQVVPDAACTSCGASDGGVPSDAAVPGTDAGCASCGTPDSGCSSCGTPDAGAITGDAGVHHYLYVIPQAGSVDVYDFDNGFQQIKSTPVSQLQGTGYMLGAIASPSSGMLYISAGYQGPGPGHVIKYDLLNDSVAWAQTYTFDVDSAALSPDGLTLYQATGAMSSQGIWEILDATTGAATGTIDSGGTGSHDTLVSLDGTRLLMGPRHSNYLVVADIPSNTIVSRIGPVASGIRPFTVNGKVTVAFINTGGMIGFYVGDVASGAILYTVTLPNYTTVGSCGGSHGVSLSPDERELYLVDCSYGTVHVFDVTGLPGSAPVDVADIKLNHMNGEGWIAHTRDGRYAVVGDSGDVIDTSTRTIVGNLSSLQSTGIFTEVDFQNGVVSFSPLSRNQGGYIP